MRSLRCSKERRRERRRERILSCSIMRRRERKREEKGEQQIIVRQQAILSLVCDGVICMCSVI